MVQVLENKSKIERNEIEFVSNLSFSAFYADTENLKFSLENRMMLLEHYIQFLGKLLRSGFVKSNTQHVALVDVISNLQAQLETLEIRSGKTRIEDLQIAAERMGKKAQSSVTEPLV